MASRKSGQLLAMASAPLMGRASPAASASTARLITTRWSLWPESGRSGTWSAPAQPPLTPEQIELLESYQAAAWRCTEQEERFLFRSGFRLARELSLLPGGLLRL